MAERHGALPTVAEAATPPASAPSAIDYQLAHANDDASGFAERRQAQLSVNTNVLSPPLADPRQRAHSDADVDPQASPNFSPILRRRTNRAATFKTVEHYDEFEDNWSARPGREPGAEPGYDPQLPNGGHTAMPGLSAACEITVVDFSKNRMVKKHFDNELFIEFLDKPKEPWARCRWINVNGLSWDVIQAIGTKKGLHKLALEDVMNIRNRTKMDWYPSHMFTILVCLLRYRFTLESTNSSPRRFRSLFI